MGRGAPCRPLGGSGLGTLISPISLQTGKLCAPGVSGGVAIGGFGPLVTGLAAIPRLSTSGGAGPPYFAPDFDVLGLRPSDNIVRSLYVEETSGFDLPICRVKLVNVDKRLSSTILAKEQTSFLLRLGWNNPGIQPHGTFIVQRPRFKFEGSAGGRTEVEIVAYGEQVKLAVTERREVYRKIRDSEIAERIAERHGFEIDVERTNLVHDQVIQANESDYKFLAKRAKLHGFLLMVEDGVMKFHAPRPCESGVRLTCTDPEAGLNNFVDFKVQSRTFMRGLKMRISQVDPVTREEFEVTSGERPTDVERDIGLANSSEMTTVDGERPERFIANEGHEQRRDQLQEQVTRMAEASRYVLHANVSAVGLEMLRPQQIITIADVGRSSGRYLVVRAIHTISSVSGESSFSTKLELIRTGAEDLSGAGPNGQRLATQPESAGSVRTTSVVSPTEAGGG